MLKYIKAQFTSFLAFSIDFGMTIILTEVFKVWYLLASFIGGGCGGVFHFTVGRIWVFESYKKKAHLQAFKYLVMWTGHIFLTNLFIYLTTRVLNVNYAISKIIVTVMMGVSYSYIVQKIFVFK